MLRVLSLVFVLTLSGCFPYYGQPSDPSADSDPGGSGQLDSSHPGWEAPACWSCHSEGGHNSGLEPWECVTCHGRNGAPGGHAGGSPCSSCHGEPHGGDGFPDPDSCLACHP